MHESSTSTAESVRNFYDEFAPEYEAQRTSSGFSRLISNLDRAAVYAGLTSGSALEVGPGSGRITAKLLQRGLDVSVTDLSSGMLDIIAANFPDIPRYESDIEHLPHLPGYGAFDNAVACRVLPHVPDINLALGNLAAAVRPGGRVIFDLWNSLGYVGLSRTLRIKRSKVFTAFYTPAEMRRRIEDAGLDIVSERGIGFAPIPPYPLELLGQSFIRNVAHILLFVCERRADSPN